MQVTELTDNSRVFWVLTIVWLNNIELIDEKNNLLILFDKWNQVLEIKEMNDCCLFVVLLLIILAALIF